MKKMIKDFWQKSIDGKTEDFDFDKFFKKFLELLKNKLAGHGQLQFEDYLNELVREKIYNLNILKEFVYESKHAKIKITYEELLRNIFMKRYRAFKNEYCKNKAYIEMKKVFNKIKLSKNLSKRDKVLLVDECIYLQHNSNFVVGLDIDKLKEKFEK